MSRVVPRVVLDTNVVLSALLFSRGRLSALRAAWHTRQFVPLISRVTTTELMRVLGYPKFKLGAAEQRELLADYLPSCEVVEIPPVRPRIPACPDVDDEPFLELAVVGKARFLVTGDGDLQGLKLANCIIATAEKFMRALAITPASPNINKP